MLKTFFLVLGTSITTLFLLFLALYLFDIRFTFPSSDTADQSTDHARPTFATQDRASTDLAYDGTSQSMYLDAPDIDWEENHNTAQRYTPDEWVNIQVNEACHRAVVNISANFSGYRSGYRMMFRNLERVYTPEQAQKSGSGFIISEDGYILTNNHVISQINSDLINPTVVLLVALYDNTTFKATLVGTDPENDLAVLKIDPGDIVLTTLELGDSNNLAVGQKVYAFGNPFDLHNTMTIGIISSLGRMLLLENNTVFRDAIQTDASLNQGNSGGPLVNTHMKVIGINTAIFSGTGYDVGISFAIPIGSVKEVVDEIIKYGKVRRPPLNVLTGIPITSIEPDVLETLEIRSKQGFFIYYLQPNSWLTQFGLKGWVSRMGHSIVYQTGDVLISIDGSPINSFEDFKIAMKRKRYGDEITMVIEREGKQLEQEFILPNLSGSE
jgi:S1-C subfamily serine protease